MNNFKCKHLNHWRCRFQEDISSFFSVELGPRSSTKDPKIIRFTQLLDRQFKNLEPYNVLTVLQLRFPSLVWLCDKLGLEVR